MFKQFEVEQLAYLLETLVKIKESRDVEAKLMLLGYQGFKPLYQTQTSIDVDSLIDNTQITAGEEKKAGEEAYQKAVMITEEEKEKTIEEFKKSMSFDNIASTFGGAVVLDEPPLPDGVEIKRITED